MNYKNITNCRLCGSKKLIEVVEFAPQYIASTFVKQQPKHQIKIPLTLLLCSSCKLIQLKETVNPELLYKNYFYRSNITNTMKHDLLDVVKDARLRVELIRDDYVLDIGCNDGLMLTFYPRTVNKVGIDPAENIDRSELSFDNKTQIITDYFPSVKLANKFKIITSTAMFYDLGDPNRAVRNIKKLLHPQGVAVIQVSYLYDTIKDLNFYDICHEHLEYYSLSTLTTLFERNGMKIVDASTNRVNGGSLRVIVKHDGTNNLSKIAASENQLKLNNPGTYKQFAGTIERSARKIRDYISSQRGLVVGLGASTKGNVLMQICGLTKEDLPYISDRNPEKVGLQTLGLGMKIISEEQARKMKPELMFVIPWNFKEEIVAREQDYIQSGGKLLFIMPYPYYLDKSGEHKL